VKIDEYGKELDLEKRIKKYSNNKNDCLHSVDDFSYVCVARICFLWSFSSEIFVIRVRSDICGISTVNCCSFSIFDCWVNCLFRWILRYRSILVRPRNVIVSNWWKISVNVNCSLLIKRSELFCWIISSIVFILNVVKDENIGSCFCLIPCSINFINRFN